ncbi:CBN-CED-7 protein [Caenorhabditis brenneri]|uniref:CBN-CED-7 protein n=1 Tax=Caenorhabditis brenneri TaxID=135651 RepID=G0MK66_CAEBE|nr:CBN-CED-7 protein [Caenorhabditis brenneri]
MNKLRQFSLLLWKDWILLRRNKVWTLFELIIPCLLLGPLVYLVVKNADSTASPENLYDSFKLTGTVEDVFLEYTFMKPIYRRWCLRSDVIFGYTCKDPAAKAIVDDIMQKVSGRFQSSKLKMSVKNEESEDQLLQVLRDDLPLSNETFCPVNSFVGGIVFDTVDLPHKILRYRILLGKATEEVWHLTENSFNPYGPQSGRGGRIPSSPPYWSAAYLTLQHAVETSFVSSAQSESKDSSITFRGLPEPRYKTSSVSAFIDLFPFIWAFVTFINVIHITREIAAENGAVKPYLTAMGLSTFMFYAAHVVMAFIKFFIIFVFSVIPLAFVMEFVSPAALILTVLMYGLGAVIFGAFIASFFDNTNSAIKAILVAWGAMIGISYKFRPDIDQISSCFLYGLNINGAFALAVEAISDYMRRERELNILNMFNDSTLHFSLGWALVMMIVDILWMSAAALVVDHIRTSSDFSLRALFTRGDVLEEYENQTDGVTAYNTRINEQMNPMGTSSLRPTTADSDALLEGSTEIDGARDTARADISVGRLVKIWSSTGERAVDGLSLRAVRGQCSVLLGHNGAGKSTTFSSIAGIIKPTYGHISICGHDVGTEPEKTRNHIGMCPQYNPLYDKLTVSEHLQLVHGLKGARKHEFKEEMKRLLNDVKLDFKENERAMNLSGGMKRKLCVCMALIGDSEVVLLDEPTAGMDPGARQDVQKLIEREKANRTILLTTHYMDEAERLGDWVFIMSHGKLVASGTNQYLKQKFGTGYLLTVVLDHNGEKRKMTEVLTSICTHFVEGAERGEMHGQQIEIILPEVEKKSFVPLFQALEAIQDRNFRSNALDSVPNQLKSQLAVLVMKSFGLSLNTLEQVFITIGDKVDKAIASRQNSRISHHSRNTSEPSLKPPGYDTQSSTKSFDSYQKLMDSQARGPDMSGSSKVASQFAAILRKKLLYSVRNWTQLFGQVLIPIILLGLVASLSTLKSNNSDQYRSLSTYGIEPSKVVWRFDDDGTIPEEATKFESLLNKSSGFQVLKYSEKNTLLNITTSLIGEMPPASIGMTQSKTPGIIETLFNVRYYHVLPTVVSMINRARLSVDSQIEGGVFLYSKSTSDTNLLPSQLIDVLLTPMLILIFAMVTSTFVMFLIEERTCQFAHQQFLTGISPITFYSASLIYDGILYTLICMIFLGMFLLFNWMYNHLAIVILFWILYFFSSVPFIYAVSFLFQSPSKANVMLIIWQVVISGAALVAVFVIFMLFDIDPTLKSFLMNGFLFLLPSYAFGSAIITINTYGFIITSEELMKWDHCGKNAVLMFAFGVCSFILFVLLQFKFVRRFLSQVWTIRRSAHNNVQPMMGDLPVCPSVEEERNRVHNANPQNLALAVKDLTKTFGRFTALNELCLAVDQKECFGLLGVNGAGKTTTFNILTGQSFATSGEATIGGHDVTEHISIGYCPQFDALMLDLTGRESLEILAQMHGFSDYKAKAELILECVGMQAHADKLVRFYSGGQKRKISVGVALLAPTQMIILDEPTAGIDPKARREVWELLLWCREHSNSALMLTSHSMDECEALCSRIAVLNRGSLIAIGSSQELKSLYGNNYTMTLTLYEPAQRDVVVQLVAARLPNSILKTTPTNKTLNLKWQIPKEKNDCWSEKFEMVQNLAKDFGVKDFILAQSSLEETFLRLAGLDEDQMDTHSTVNVTHSTHV